MARSNGSPIHHDGELVIGIDVGSTTVKAVVVDPNSLEILWSDYQRHETRQAEKCLELLTVIHDAFPGLRPEQVRAFITGSGAGPIAEPVGARFVQEVNAVTLAVEHLHPDVGSVVELGGQDAKIIIFIENPETGEKQAICSMNDKCASGTGATIDKCMIKVGMPSSELNKLTFDATKLHKVAAKCGVFAETDIVNLVKSGIPSPEIICSLADAIVTQNLSVLTRGNTLRHQVLLLGGPNTYLPFLQEAWRLRIPETWAERDYQYPKDKPLDEVIIVPENAQYYAAYGAVVYGLDEPGQKAKYRGLAGLEDFITHGRLDQLGNAAGPPLVGSMQELEAFRAKYEIPGFVSARFEPGQKVQAVIGLDGGSTSSKAVLLDPEGEVLAKAYKLSEGNPIQDMKDLLADLKDQVISQGAELEILGFGATGYAADVLEESVKADANIVETVAHMMSAVHYFGEIDVICDIGGQDIKVLFMQNGDIKNFRLSNQCSAGNGMLLQAMADQFGVPLKEYAATAFRATLSPTFSYGCAVFLDTDRVNFQKEGYAKEELLAGLAMVLPKNVWQYVVQIPRMAELGTRFVLQGGTQYNLAAVKAQVDYISERVPGAQVFVHPHTGEAGAIGAGLETLRLVLRRGESTFIGLDAAIDLTYTTRNDEETRCDFCANTCSRTFIDTRTPQGDSSRYIAGFSCEKGTVESRDAMVKLVKRRKELKKQYVNLAEYEARLAFKSFHEPKPLPEAGTPIEDTEVKLNILGKIKRVPLWRGFRRSDSEAAEKRQSIRIGIPRVLNLYSTAPLFRTYFEALGIQTKNVVFSETTGEEMWKEGAKYGSVDPCFPSKVVQSHIHNLLFRKHTDSKPLNYIFFPSMTHIPTFVKNTMDNAACPIVSGSPCVTSASFTKEKDYFAERRIGYVFDAITLEEPLLLRRQMFEMWGERLGVTEDESDFAMNQAWEAMRLFDEEMERRGMEVLEQIERENKVALLLLGRPYHLDPGLNHGLLEEFQAQGYAVLTIRSIPKDEAWLGRWFREELETGKIPNPLDINDVWPENYSANSVQKVWATKFAARHPNIGVIDLSSFKCGHDAPVYGLIDSIIKAGKTPYMALHDIDANKPSGSMKIRVKTFTHTLRRFEDELADKAQRMSELERRMLERRRQLLQVRRDALIEQVKDDCRLQLELAEMETAFVEYLEEDEEIKGMRLARTDEVGVKRVATLRDDISPAAPYVKILELAADRVAKRVEAKPANQNKTSQKVRLYPPEPPVVEVEPGIESNP
ncbi:MAG: CoA activase [Deltaproteobacteria bacterium CG_4_9_14_3_um_filter_63_12]|nr:MAG: CoA activase [Deltaproteobacteria bacterium CG_4_9_14_3_um_filter_63_12]